MAELNRRHLMMGSGALASTAMLGLAPGCSRPSAWLTERIAGLPAEHGFPGMTAGITLTGGETLTAAAGLADRETGEAMTPAHVMAAGSTGKTFVAAGAVDLVLRGELDLDAPVGTWLSDRDWFSDLAHADAITPRLLLLHRSGIAEYYAQESFVRAHSERLATDPDRAFATDETIPIALAAGPVFEPDTGFSYADTNYLLIGLIIEAITGTSYEDHVRTRLLEPHGLTQGILAPQSRVIPGLASSYMEQGAFGVPSKAADGGVIAMHPMTEWTGGGMTTRADALSRWGHVWFGGRAFDTAYSAMIRQAPQGSSVIQLEGEDWRYGMGCEMRLDPGPRFIGHRGWFPAFMSVLCYRDDLDMSVALQFNQVPSAPGLYTLANTLMDEAAAL
ncbi:serine hydrolase domain-containing protein [Hyphobacterium sp. HN65]|uniref:Serine hydrolase domain-containing protein n=1 Tax=Hyphobacterium lacteum TaxID=3116575 RepID=A0ABU7LSQ0_9PROT|nr:serine hydrolase domain-containing protein [Hyphobacterium sp. HN65]MEE2526928.1 serine hydrolase domain-containing protein [Hyphobacterium sp. HN65]